MIRKLQIKFILLSMLSLLLVLIVIIGGLNILNYKSVIDRSDRMLSLLQNHDGEFPRKKDKLPQHISPETPYELRYFSVRVDDTAKYFKAKTKHVAAVDEATAVAYAKTAIKRNKDHGFIDEYRYDKYTEDNVTHIVFLDCGRSLDTFQESLINSIGISLLGYIVVFMLITIFSAKIVRPVSESYEKQKRFITDAGHEIKTPLTIIKADAEVLENEIGTNEWIDDIMHQANRLASLTNDLIQLSKMEEASNAFPMIDFPISDIVSEAAASFQSLAQVQEKEFELAIQPMLTIKGNEKSMHQLTDILLDNAIKYSPAGGKISVSLLQQGKNLRLTVYNTTENTLPRENLNQLFERFYRTDPSRNSETGGHGIGLSMAKAIVSAHNGKITASIPHQNSLEISVIFTSY